jgi:Fur family ferric uptake transcriptional regulator
MLTNFKAHGYKITNARKWVIDIIDKKPLTIKEIHTTLANNQKRINLTSVYRTVKLLAELGLVREIDLLDGFKRYEVVSNNNHHHHLVCKSCGKIEDFSLPNMEKTLHNISLSNKFQMINHTLEIFGKCYQCKGNIC